MIPKQLVRILIVMGIFCFFTICIASTKMVSPEKLSAVKKISVVPMEAVPLDINPLSSATANKAVLSGATWLAGIPEAPINQVGRVAVLAAGIPMLISLPQNITGKMKTARDLEDALSGEEAWLPSVILSQIAAKQIASHGSCEAIAIQDFHRFPSLYIRERTWHLMNWSRAITDWFNSDLSAFSYREWSDQGTDAVMEISVSSVIGIDNRLLLEAYAKLIDTSTNKVFGRARRYKTNPKKIRDVFERDGASFKELFAVTGSDLVAEVLAELGLPVEKP
jgi:hypothetical protein